MVTFQIPGGPMNLAPIFPGVDFSKVEEYYLELIDRSDDAAILTTTRYKRGCCCSDDVYRIFFVNYLGGIDAVNFTMIVDEHESTSERWKKKLKTPMQKWDGGMQRFNVTGRDIITVENSCFLEKDREWLKELIDAPNAWVQWIGTQGQDNDYLPIVISDGKFVMRKVDERYRYVLQLQFTFANEKIILRN